eukprot:358738-Chlamydomonas_euryale.AAC.7
MQHQELQERGCCKAAASGVSRTCSNANSFIPTQENDWRAAKWEAGSYFSRVCCSRFVFSCWNCAVLQGVSSIINAGFKLIDLSL